MSLEFDTLEAGFRDRGLPFTVVDLGAGRPVKRAGAFDFCRAVVTLQILLRFYSALYSAGNVYITIGCSRLGFFRDALMIWPSKWMHRRTVLHLHSGGYGLFYQAQPKWLKRLIQRTLAQADKVIVLGELLRDQFSFLPNASEQISVIRNCLPKDMEASAPVAKTLVTGGSVNILYLSNMIKSKGYLDVLMACRILKDEYHLPIHCDFCGEFISTVVSVNSERAEIDRANFMALISEWGLEDTACYHGVVRGNEKKQFLLSSHVLVLPTAYPWEGQPISIIEALSYSTPVIATRFRGIPEQVIDGFNGFLVDANSPAQIAAAIKELADNTDLYHKLSANAITHYKQFFTPQKHLDQIIPLISGK